MGQSNNGNHVRPYQVFILALSLYALAALSVEVVAPVSPPIRELLQVSDTVVCVLFMADFLYQLARAPNKWAYFSRWGWIDLLSSVPMIDILRVGRLARVVRILRVLRGVRSTKVIAGVIMNRRAEAVVLAAALLALLLIVFASIAVLQFEVDQMGANIKTAGDALWWAVATVTTVGYGDRLPVSAEGRVVASVLMIAGVGLFGTLSGFVASWFLAPSGEQNENELQQLRLELAELKQMLLR